MRDRLKALLDRTASIRNNGRAGAALIMTDEPLKKEIDAVYSYYFGKVVTGCVNCYADALAELSYHFNKKTAIIMKTTTKFVVRRGKVLKDVISNDRRKNMVRGNETDNLALYHLYTNPAYRSKEYFEDMPDEETLDAMLDEYGENFEAQRAEGHGGEASEAVKAARTINDANDKAAEILDEANEKKERIENEIVDLKTQAEEIKNESQKFIDEANARVTEITDAAIADAEKLIEDAKVEASEIVERAEADADEIVKAAKAEAKAVKKATTAKEDPMLK